MNPSSQQSQHQSNLSNHQQKSIIPQNIPNQSHTITQNINHINAQPKHNINTQPKHNSNNQYNNKMETYILGQEPFTIDPEDQEIRFISSRIINIKEGALLGPKLKILQLRNNLIKEMDHFIQCSGLVQLQLYDNKICSIKGLNKMNVLQILDLSYNNVKRIEGLEACFNLKKLYLLNNKLKKIQNLQLPTLELLELGSNKISQIENLEGVPNLTALFLGKNRIKEIQNLHTLHKLEQLALGPNLITKINVNLICLKHSLRQLYLQENQICAIENLEELRKLQIVDISYNRIEHIQGLETLIELDALYLNSNRIQEFKQLQNLVHNQKLTTVSFFGNDIYKYPDYRSKLNQMLPLIDDIDGTPMKTVYKVVFNSKE